MDTVEEGVLVGQAGTNNMAPDRSEESLGKYWAIIRKLEGSRRKVLVAGPLRRHHLGPAVFME